MDCVNHSGVNATAYCQQCGKPLCSTCSRAGTGGQMFCEPCFATWRGTQPPAYMPPPPGTPNPGLAAVLGLVPGVGAMYNGQFIKGLVHLLIFAVLVSASHEFYGFGWLVFGWICYQVFEAYYTAKARRDGEPLPDPLGLNEIGNLFNQGARSQPGSSAGAPWQAPAASNAQPDQPPPEQPSEQQPSGQASYRTPDQAPYTPPFQPVPGPGISGPGIPPIPPPVPPVYWRRREPIGAIVLIALGLLFLAGRLDLLSGRVFTFGWPVVLIALGVWLIVRRVHDTRHSSQQDSQGGPQ
jgi:TM2 domain-containing membrane protein YozV